MMDESNKNVKTIIIIVLCIIIAILLYFQVTSKCDVSVSSTADSALLAEKEQKIASLESEITTLNTKVVTLTKEITTLKESEVKVDDNIEEKEYDVSELEEKINNLTTQKNNLNKKITKLNKELDDTKNELNESNATIVSLKGNLTITSNTISNLKSENKSLNNLLLETNVTIADLTNEKKALTNEKTSLNTTIATLTNEKTSLNNQITTLNNEKTSLNNQITTLNNEKTSLNTQIETLNTQKDTLNGEITTLKTEKTTLNTTITDLNNQIKELKTTIDELKEEIKTLKNTYVVFFVANDTTIDTQMITKGGNATLPVFETNGIRYDWDSDGVNITSNQVIHGKEYCTITFTSEEFESDDNGTMESLYYYYDDEYEVECGTHIRYEDNENDGKNLFVNNFVVTSGYENENSTYSISFEANGEEIYNNSDYVVNGPTEIRAIIDSCVIAGTKVTMADGTKKNVEDLRINDEVLTYDFEQGKFITEKVIANMETSSKDVEVIKLTLENGSVLEIIQYEYIFDMDSREYILVHKSTLDDLIGKRVMTNENGNRSSSKIVSVTTYNKKTSFNSIYTTGYNNFLADDILTKEAIYWINDYYIVDEDYKIDQEQYNKDVEKYGLYTYDELKDYVSEELFVSQHLRAMKFIEGKGIATKEEIIDSLKIFNNEIKRSKK